MKCLACWEEIEDGEKVCHHCGSNQEEVKDYLTLAVLKQQKKKVTVPQKTPMLSYLETVDPVLKEEIVVSSTEISPPPQAYQPERPTWLGTSLATQKPSSKELIPQEPPRKKTKKKTVKCPNCDKETPDLKFCKYCGYQLNKECPKCGTKVKTNVRFCSECGYNFDE
ncbi:MAG: double zinc ribbon domain-containing protein [Candidatus Heimdallarchaeaceae archaeon]